MVNLDVYGKTPKDILLSIAENEKNRRKQQRLTQRELATRSGISLPSLRRFEQKGEISLKGLVKIATILNCQEEFLSLFPSIQFKSIEELINAEHNKGRRIHRK